MRRLIVILLTLACGSLLAGLALAVDGPNESELAEQVRAHINERMYETCKSVVLKHEANTVYRGYAEFLNGVRVDLEVSVSDNAIEYRFLERPQPQVQAMQTRLDELEKLVVELEAEIARLRALCLWAGIEVAPPQTEAPSTSPEDANGVAAEPAWEPPATVTNDQEEIAKQGSEFTWRVYETIQKGMSYAETVALLGDPGHLISGSYFDDAENEVFVWTNPDDSHLCVVFRDKTVLVKTQFGLPETTAEPPR